MMSSQLAPGDACVCVGLESRSDLNGRSARVVSWDSKRERWNVFIEGESKKLALSSGPDFINA